MANDHARGCYHARMKNAEPELSPPAVQLLRYALSLDLSATYTSDGQVIISKGAAPAVALSDPCAASEDFVADDANEDADFAEELHRIEYWAKWTVADDYPSADDQNWRRWAWEFLRRNEQYALLATWMNSLPDGTRLREESKADDLLEHVLCDPAPLAGQRTVGDYREHCRANGIHAVIAMPILVLRHCWGVNRPLSPKEEFLDLSREEQDSFFCANTPKIVTPAHFTHEAWLPDFPFQEVQSVLLSNEILLKFDLNEPLEGQFERAFERLRELRQSYFMKSRLEMMAPGDWDSIDKDLGFVSDPKNYTKALQLQLRIFDAANINGGFLTGRLRRNLVEIFSEELYSRGREFDSSFLPAIVNEKRITDWHSAALNIVGGNYKALVRYKPLSEAQKQRMRDRKQEADRN